MGRQKVKIARLESALNRRITYGKRMKGIAKKVKDLSHVCDVDVVVLMFHPNGKKATLCLGENRELLPILERYSKIGIQEREGRIRESQDLVKKMMRKIGHDVETQTPQPSMDESESLEEKAEKLKNKIKDVQEKINMATYRLSCWESPETVTNMDMLDDMEIIVRKNLQQLKLQKESMIVNEPAV
ncbi:hypothetical protein ZOSMA_2G03630 [Zostera marina]|uniref:MADS-box domain-containing protein n=1 Tax=Zostera marina TaxID=29655 RepID=A0A0K9PBK3_ZOSMR|nr:hypothetical protein ZOSMA_2G03630 [Zostera marina]